MPRLRLLWVTPYLPRRGVSAAREYCWALLSRLAPRHDVTLLAFADAEEADTPDAALPPGLAAVHRVVRRPWRPDDPLALLPQTVAGGFSDPAFAAAVAERLGAARFDLAQYEFVEMANVMPPVPPLPSVLTVHQLGFAQEAARWRAEGRRPARVAVHLHRWLRLLDFELRAVARAHHVIAVSAEDAARLARFHPGLPVSVSPVGVDCRHFRPAAEAPAASTDVLFVGHFGHPPNADAVRFLVRDVLPRLGPVRLRIVGHAIPPELAALAGPAVEIAGAVPDVRPHLAAARAVVAPVRFGTGMRGKVLEALAAGRPVVTTSLGAEGLGATSGTHLLVADGAPGFAAALGRVLDDPALAARLGAGGRALAEARFDWDVVAAGLEEIHARVLREAGTRRPPRVRPDRSAALRRLAAPLGRAAALGAGTALLTSRALAWHLGRARRPIARRAVGAPATAGSATR